MIDFKTIADNADLIINGYAFTKSGDYIRVLNLNRPNKALVFDYNQEVIETSMDDIEIQIVFDYYNKNKKYKKEVINKKYKRRYYLNNTNENINHGVSRQLSGKDNERLYSTTRVNSAYTAAILNKDDEYPDSKVTIPSLESVLEAKDWVDNGSKT